MNVPCKICESEDGHKRYMVKEMLFGMQESFAYLQCAQCGCLFIGNIPDDLSRYYASDHYFSFNNDITLLHPGKFSRFLMTARNQFYLTKRGLLGRLLSVTRPCTWYPSVLKSLDGLNLNSHILEVGCGDGALLARMYNFGFKNLNGIDPFLKDTSVLRGYVHLRNIDISELPKEETYDWIFFQHSLEHTRDHVKTLTKAVRHLKPGGKIYLSIPFLSFLWERYREHWAGVDAPRHIIIHSDKSFRLLLEKTGLRLQKTWSASDRYRIVLSEQQKKGIPQYSKEEKRILIRNDLFTEDELSGFKEDIEYYNLINRADVRRFILMKK